MTPTHTVARGDRIWASEQAEARRLGCEMQVRFQEGALQHTAYARITPTTPRARTALAIASGVAGQDTVEAHQSFTEPQDAGAAMHQAITCALGLAHDALA